MKPSKRRKNLQKSSGRQKINSLDPDDKISPLPDSILGVILSFLPTKDAIATAILSNRWKFVWMTVNNLDFRYEGCWNFVAEGEDMKFVRFVTGVLLVPDAGSLNRFRLTWNPFSISSSHVSSWINTALTRHVRDLFLSHRTPIVASEMPDPFEMPIRVFSCETLQSLELNGCFSVSAAVCLPRLQKLKLVSFYFQSVEALEKLIRGSPMLNYLHIYMDVDLMADYLGVEHEFAYIISSSSLRHLELYFEDRCDLHELAPNCSLKLEASSLEYLKLVGFIPKIFVQKGLSSLVEVDFRIYLLEEDFSQVDICNSIVELVRAFDCAKTLTLSPDAMWALSCATINLSTDFKRLVKLETSTYCADYSSLRDFIQCSDGLEVLTIYQVSGCIGKSDHLYESKWSTRKEVPKCLSNSLKKVVFNSYYGYDDDDEEYEMIRYVLKHGNALKVMKIPLNSFKDSTKLKLLHEICRFPRMSSACEVQFFG